MKPTLDIWQINLDSEIYSFNNCFTTLSHDEQNKALSYNFIHDQKRYVVGRYCLRVVLSKYLSIAPNEIRFKYNKYGKPSLLNNNELEFNFSHSNEKALLLIGDTPCGIDIENKNNNVDIMELAVDILSHDEYLQFIKIDQRRQKEIFYRIWTCKEAFIKCIGLGFSFDIKNCEVIFKQYPLIDIKLLGSPNYERYDYYIYPLKVEDSNYMATAVTTSAPRVIQYHSFQV